MTPASPPLPRLAFGNAIVQTSTDLDAFLAAQRSVMPAVTSYEPLTGRKAFRHALATVRIGDLRLVASASNPLAMAAGDSRDSTLLIPFHGWSTTVIDGREHRWQAGNSAMLVPGAERTGESGVRSKLGITFNPQRLQAVASTMLGPRSRGRLDLGLHKPRVIPLTASRSPAMALLKQVLPLIDLGGGSEANLRMLGLDDTLYRILAVMLAPEVLAPSFDRGPATASSAAISRATEYIVGHLDQPITLGDLERVSGLSARGLQLAFRKHYNCPPREWIQRRRLLMARERLLAQEKATSVAAVALACGFTRLGAFAVAYEQRFGELPSATLARARRG
ncbi:MAG: helix-turn-helix domain-containing protein [Planctomycetaceae bacterium]